MTNDDSSEFAELEYGPLGEGMRRYAATHSLQFFVDRHDGYSVHMIYTTCDGFTAYISVQPSDGARRLFHVAAHAFTPEPAIGPICRVSGGFVSPDRPTAELNARLDSVRADLRACLVEYVRIGPLAYSARAVGSLEWYE